MSATTTPTPDLPTNPIPVRIRRVTSEKTISNLVMLIFGILFTAPLVWIIFASFDSQASSAVAWPHFTLNNFKDATSGSDLQALLNSVYISAIATAVSTIPAILAAYAFSRHRIPWKGPMLLFILMLSGVPVSILIVPVYEEFSKLGYLSLIPAAIFVGVTSLPFEIWIIKNFIDQVPQELEEAARLERANTLQVLTRVVMPVALPGIASAAIFGFINAWGNFLVPLVLIADPGSQPAPVAIFSFFGSTTVHYGDVAAYSIIYSLPVVILYLIMSRLFRGGSTFAGAIRG